MKVAEALKILTDRLKKELAFRNNPNRPDELNLPRMGTEDPAPPVMDLKNIFDIMDEYFELIDPHKKSNSPVPNRFYI